MNNNRYKIEKFIGFFVSIALIFQMVFLSVGGVASGKGVDGDVPMYVIPPPEPRDYTSEWLIMLYSAGDNNLEYHLMDDLDEMETIGSTYEVAIAAWMDRWNGETDGGTGSTPPSLPGVDPIGDGGSIDDRSNNNWIGTKRLFINQNQDRRDDATGQNVDDIFLWSPQENIGEKNMGNPNSLVSFVNWATSWYPANKYALILSDHGGGSSGMDGVCWDWHTAMNERLTPQELSSALSTITDSGINIDVLIFNVCLQANFENYLELSDTLPQQTLLLGSEEVMSYDGIPFNSDFGGSILQWLTLNYMASSPQLAMKIIDEYQTRFSSASNAFATYSVVDNSKLADLEVALDVMTQILITLEPTYRSEIQGALDVVDKCDYSPSDPLYWIVDMKHFVYELKNRIPDANFQNSAQTVLDSISGCVVDEWHGSLHPNFAGLTVYFPNDINIFLKYLDFYKSFDIASTTHWDDFITQFYCGGDSTPPTITIDQATYGWYSSDPGNVIKVYFDSGTTIPDYYNSILNYAQYKVGITGVWRSIFTSNEKSYGTNWHISWGDLQEGENTVYIRCADLGGNVAEATITVKKDTGPIISSPHISESSPDIYCVDTILYYSDMMGSTPHTFTIEGLASDVASGLIYASATSAFWDSPPDDTTPDSWSFAYDVIDANNGDGTITVTVYASSGYSKTVTFDYYEDNTPPDSPSVSSSSHSDENAWYSNKNPTFSWSTPPDISGIEGYYYAFDQISNTEPTTIWTIENSMSYNDVSDGTWWFHVAAKDNLAHIGTTSHYKVQIDTVSPGIPNPQIISGQNTMNPTFEWANPGDVGSGVSGYYFKVNDDPYEWTSSTQLTLSLSMPGTNHFYLYAVDHAGNIGPEAMVTFWAEAQGIYGSVVYAAREFDIYGSLHGRPVPNNGVQLWSAVYIGGTWWDDQLLAQTLTDSEGYFHFPLTDPEYKYYVLKLVFNTVNGVYSSSPYTFVRASAQDLTYTTLMGNYGSTEWWNEDKCARGIVKLYGQPVSGVEVQTVHEGIITKITDANGEFEFSTAEDGMPFLGDWCKYWLRISPLYEVIRTDWLESHWLPFRWGIHDGYYETIYIRPRETAPGCPFVWYNNQTTYISDNNILPTCEMDSERKNDVIDWYKLNGLPAPDGDTYRLEIRETENEISYIDKVMLATVDHSNETTTVTTIDGDLFALGNIVIPSACEDCDGNNLSDWVNSIDDSYLQTKPGDTILLEFDVPDDASRAILVSQSRMSDYTIVGGGPGDIKTTLCVQMKDANGNWNNISVFAPRNNWALSAVDLSEYLDGTDDSLEVRIYSTQFHDIDFLGIDFSNSPYMIVNYYELSAAGHSELGNVLAKLRIVDEQYSTIMPGEKLSLAFPYVPSTLPQRDIVLITTGNYRKFSSIQASRNITLSASSEATGWSMFVVEKGLRNSQIVGRLNNSNPYSTFKAYPDRSYTVWGDWEDSYNSPIIINVCSIYDCQFSILPDDGSSNAWIDISDTITTALGLKYKERTGRLIVVEPSGYVNISLSPNLITDLANYSEFKWTFDNGGIYYSIESYIFHEFDAVDNLTVSVDGLYDGNWVPVLFNTLEIQVNAPPVPEIEIYQEVETTLKVTGRKGNTVTLEIYEDGELINRTIVTRTPGKPDAKTIVVHKYLNWEYVFLLIYDAPYRDQNPTWLTFKSGNNEETFFIDFDSDDGIHQEVVVDLNLLETVVQGNRHFYFDAYDSCDIDGKIVSYEWGFGDGFIGTGKLVEYAFADAGTYTVTLTITDDDGAVATIAREVEVS